MALRYMLYFTSHKVAAYFAAGAGERNDVVIRVRKASIEKG